MSRLWFILLMLLGACQSTTQSTAAEAPNANDSGDSPDVTASVSNKPDFLRRYTGKITAGALSEISGMAVSQRDKNVLWVVNDSGHKASIYAVNTGGDLLGEVSTSVNNRDWESLTSLTLDGLPYLLVGDSGDNLGIHKNYRLHLFAEPTLETLADTSEIQPVSTTVFVYVDGHRNSEAVAWSATDQQVLLISKRTANAAVYATGLTTPDETDSVFSAQRLGSVATPPQSVSDNLLSSLAGVDMAQITGFEIAPDGRQAYVLTYRGVYVYTRLGADGHEIDRNSSEDIALEDWGNTFSRSPRLLTRHTLTQAEALALSPHTGELWYTSENLPAPLWRLSPRQPAD